MAPRDVSGEAPSSPGGTRVDRYLWSIRLFKSRSDATEACRRGHVRVNRSAAKASTTVRAGDFVEATVAGRERRVEVVRVIERRVGAPAAAECFVDHSPPPPPPELAPPLLRDPSTGRPTKRDRRQIERLRRR